MSERTKKVNILKFQNGESVHLCDSEPTADPDQGGVGYKTRKSVVWARAGEGGAWFRTGHKSQRKAMDALLNHQLRTAEQGVAHLAATAPMIGSPNQQLAIEGRVKG